MNEHYDWKTNGLLSHWNQYDNRMRGDKKEKNERPEDETPGTRIARKRRMNFCVCEREKRLSYERQDRCRSRVKWHEEWIVQQWNKRIKRQKEYGILHCDAGSKRQRWEKEVKLGMKIRKRRCWFSCISLSLWFKHFPFIRSILLLVFCWKGQLLHPFYASERYISWM